MTAYANIYVMWMYLVLLYGVFKGLREICKKKALEISTPLEVLLVYSLISFVMVIPDIGNAWGLAPIYYLWIALKSFFVWLAWICSFKAIKQLPISLYGVLDLSRVLFATLLAMTVLGERLGGFQIAGLILVALGLLALKYNPLELFKSKKAKESETKLPLDAKQKRMFAFNVFLAFSSCALNALSGLMDKILMKDINSSQLQFWYMLFLVLFYFIYAAIAHKNVHVVKTLKNKWVWLLSILFVIADRALFIANADPDSRITVMTLIKQSGCIVTILAGKFIFKEKKTAHKFFCAGVIIIGIVLGVLK